MKYELIMTGGIGNQLFILLEAYRLYSKEKKIALNISKYSFGNEPRAFNLKNIHPCIENDFPLKQGLLACLNFLLINRLEKIFAKPLPNDLMGGRTFSFKLMKWKILRSGYFQNINNSEIDLKALRLLKSKLKPFFNGEKINCLAIHVRRGDYLLNEHSSHGIVEEKVLINEAKKIFSETNLEGITIFTDSPDLINVNKFKEITENVFIDETTDPSQVLRNMSLHKALIASNSSFSLWAGLIGDPSIFKIPSEWVKNESSYKLGLEWIERYEVKLI